MVNWWKSNLDIGNASIIGVWNAGQGRTQKAKNNSFAVRFCQYNSEPIRIHHSTFDYVIPLFLTCQKKTQSIIAQSCPQSPPKSFLVQQKEWQTFLKQEMILSTGDGSWLLVYLLKFDVRFGTKSINSKRCHHDLTQRICCGQVTWMKTHIKMVWTFCGCNIVPWMWSG
jgi:hypothetical protein